jgi:uncharacterized phiE125 gp8 family phage protein
VAHLVTITEPATAAVTTAEARTHLSLGSDTSHDTMLDALVLAATKRVEAESGLKMFEQTVELRMDGFPADSDSINLQVSPVQSVDSVKYDDADDAEQTWASSSYWTDLLSVPARVTTKTSWPTTKSGKPGSVRIRMTVGKADAADIPEIFKLAIKLLVAHWFVNREETTPVDLRTIPYGVRDLIWANSETHFLILR